MEIKAKKALGQHFLNSTAVLNKIISAAKLNTRETVLEIGPGTGVLTEQLLKNQVKVIAIEKDREAYDLLKSKFAGEINNKRLILIEDDTLNIEIKEIINGPYVIIANIPYYITGAILEKFLESDLRPDRMILLVQKEVAQRIVANDGKESILSISVKAFGTPKYIDTVKRGSFTPAPKVDSAIIAIENISDEQFRTNKLTTKNFFTILRAGFAHKRKYLKSNLEAVSSKEKVAEVWKILELPEKARAEDIRVETWFEIAKRL